MTIREKILEVLRASRESKTTDELVDLVNSRGRTVSARMAELRRDGLVYVANHRKSKTGTAAKAWLAVGDGPVATSHAQSVDPYCGHPLPPNVSRASVVAYLATVSEEEWNAILTEAACAAAE